MIFKGKTTCNFSSFHRNQKIWLSGVLIMSYWISGRVSTIIWITSRYCSKILTCFLKKKSWKKFRYGWAFEIMQFWSKFGYILKYLRMKYFSFWIPVDPWIKIISNDNWRGCFWFHLKKFDTCTIFLEDVKSFIFDLQGLHWVHFRVIKFHLIFKGKNTCNFSEFHRNQKIWLCGGLIMSHWISGRVSTIIWITSRYC